MISESSLILKCVPPELNNAEIIKTYALLYVRRKELLLEARTTTDKRFNIKESKALKKIMKKLEAML